MPVPVNVPRRWTYGYSEWSSRFTPDQVIPSVVITLDDDFVDYLCGRDDGLFQLPIECDEAHNAASQLSDSEDSDDADDDNMDDDDEPPPRPPSFPALVARITDAIRTLSSAFPKLDSCAPLDAAFLIPRGDGDLRCKTAADVVMLLKGSGRIARRLSARDAVDGGGGGGGDEERAFELVLKRWTHLDPLNEFRAFVCHKRLVAVSPRTAQFNPALLEPNVAADVVESIDAFFNSTVRDAFPDDAYVFDVHLSSLTKPRVLLLDISPYGPPTSPLLFTSWSDLPPLSPSPSSPSRPPELKTIGSEEEAVQLDRMLQGQTGKEKVPYELVDLAEGETDVAALTRRWHQALRHAAS